MSTVGKTPKQLSDSMPPLKDQGMPYLAAAGKAGVSVQGGQIIQSGGSPYTVVLADHGLSDMEDALYAVTVGGETVGAPKVDQSTITATGFDIAGGADAEVLHVQIVGRLKDQVA